MFYKNRQNDVENTGFKSASFADIVILNGHRGKRIRNHSCKVCQYGLNRTYLKIKMISDLAQN